MNESHEEALIRRCQAKDKQAFGTLVEHYRNVLFGTAYLIMRDKGSAEDIVQEALVKIWKHLSSFRLKSSIKTWMLRVVINEAKQQTRGKKLTMILLESVKQATGGTDEPEAVLTRNEERRSLRYALDQLKPDQREAVVLRYYSDLTVPEIAAVTGEREGTIKSRLNRAKNRLGEILRNDRVWGEGR